MSHYKTINKCRVCGASNLTDILSLGDLYVSDFIDDSTAHLAQKAPLDLALCSPENNGCGLLQLRHSVSGDLLYRNYWYRSGINKTMTEELNGIVKKIESIIYLTQNDYVIDIGANDGTLLRSYSKTKHTVGFEPARNLKVFNEKGTEKIFNDFFGHDVWQKEFNNKSAKAITAIAMFYDLDDPNKFVADICKCLDADGVFIIQMSYLPLMLSQNAFDNICHEHLEYYSLLSLENLLKRHNLQVFDVELNDVNGGSYRVYIKHASTGRGINIPVGANKRVENLRKYEKDLGLHQNKIYDDFAKRVLLIKAEISAFNLEEVKRGKKVFVYGASTKGNTLLQYFGLDNSIITAAVERNPDKFGKRTVGTNIPIDSEENARKAKPDYFLVLPWHFMKEFLSREEDYILSGGSFIVPLPEFEIINAGNLEEMKNKYSENKILTEV